MALVRITLSGDGKYLPVPSTEYRWYNWFDMSNLNSLEETEILTELGFDDE